MVKKNNFFILSGPPGSGKSTVLQSLRRQGVSVVPEFAREIIEEQREITGNGLYDKNPPLFLDLMLSRAMYTYKNHSNNIEAVLFDRGIPDNIGYASMFDLDAMPAKNASRIHKYNSTVFFFPIWPKIYSNDHDRKLSLSESESFGHIIKNHYISLGYQICDVPFGSPQDRACFILERIKQLYPTAM